MDLSFYKGKKVLVTGHTGFKGSWMCEVLLMEGAQVMGYALEPPTEPSLFKMLRLEERMNSVVGDVRDLEHLKKVFDEFQPEIVIHMAAQPIVRESYVNPVYTYETNVMGTVNVLEAVRQSDCVKSVVNVTTDKVYRNNEWEWGYRENDPLEMFVHDNAVVLVKYQAQKPVLETLDVLQDLVQKDPNLKCGGELQEKIRENRLHSQGRNRPLRDSGHRPSGGQRVPGRHLWRQGQDHQRKRRDLRRKFRGGQHPHRQSGNRYGHL